MLLQFWMTVNLNLASILSFRCEGILCSACAPKIKDVYRQRQAPFALSYQFTSKNFPAPASRQTGLRITAQPMASSPWLRTAGAAPVPPPEAAAAAATAAATPAPTSEQHRVKVPPQSHFLFCPSFVGSFYLALQVQAELLTGACRRKETLPPRLYRSRRRPSSTCRGTTTRNCDPPCDASRLCYRNACSVLA